MQLLVETIACVQGGQPWQTESLGETRSVARQGYWRQFPAVRYGWKGGGFST